MYFLTSRKFIAFTMLLVFSCLLVTFNFLSGVEFTDLMKVAVPAYCASNTGEHMVVALKEWVGKKYNSNQ